MIITIPDLSETMAIIWVNEVDVLSLHLGQPATVRFTAFPDEAVDGTVHHIANVGSRGGEVHNFKVKVKLDRVPDGLRFGMTAHVSIHLDPIDDVLQVPVTAVHRNDDDEFAVTVIISGPDGRATEQVVGLGFSDGAMVEVRGGLDGGERIVRGAHRRRAAQASR